jgi:hypothetical protein
MRGDQSISPANLQDRARTGHFRWVGEECGPEFRRRGFGTPLGTFAPALGV